MTADRRVTTKSNSGATSAPAQALAPTRQTKNKNKYNIIVLSNVRSAAVTAELTKIKTKLQIINI